MKQGAAHDGAGMGHSGVRQRDTMAACSVAHLEGEALLDAAAAEEGGGGPLAMAAVLPGSDPPQLPLLVVDRQLSLDALEAVRP